MCKHTHRYRGHSQQVLTGYLIKVKLCYFVILRHLLSATLNLCQAHTVEDSLFFFIMNFPTSHWEKWASFCCVCLCGKK